ncbi:MAG: enoyl-CoA hydratase/isomerase family protein [Myxococcales bacterium]|nr:enoyl-CoA hydratase/isomerase family protein [Myxococcales bacterium]
MSESGKVTCERRPGRIAIVTIDRPQALNACSRAMWRELAEIWDELEQDDGVSAVVLTGAGDRAFSAGVDLNEMAQGEQTSSPYQPPPRLLENWDFEFWKPIVCAVNGLALGSGFSLMLATDIRIASETATFGMRQVKLGLLSGHATQLLPRFLSYPLAMELLLTGEPISAQRAHEIGLINRVVPPERVLEAAVEQAQEIASYPPLTLQGIKEAAVRGLDFNLRDAIVWGLRMERLNATTEDAAEGPRAFAEKRPPRWTGR